MGSFASIFLTFLRLGLTSFGGPTAHLGYFREAFVTRRHWLDDRSYADLVALCQFLPGPASSQVGMGIGLGRGGYGGGLGAWLGFTLPSAILMVLFANGLSAMQGTQATAWIHGLKIAAVAIVALAVWGMAKSLAPDRPRATLAVGAAILALAVPNVWGQLGAIGLGAIVGVAALRGLAQDETAPLPHPVGRRVAITCLVLFGILMVALPLAAAATDSLAIDLFDIFFRGGALVFGGGHVVLPLLQADLVPTGLIDNDTFLAGYGAAQAVPGPLFTFAAYLGAIIMPGYGGVPGALLCIVAIFLPSMLLVLGTLPFWADARRWHWAQAALAGINASVVGLLLAVLYDPVWTSGITNAADAAILMAAILALAVWRAPPWAVVGLCAAASAALTAF